MRETKSVIGLTGPTGAGKSTFCLFLQKMGAVIIDCDQLAREAVEDPHCLEELQKAFGEDVVENGMLQRRKLANRAFENGEKTALLNSITHPFIIALAKKQSSEAKAQGKTAVIDAPLLFEAGLESICDHTMAVWAPFEERLKRIIIRDGLTEEEARLRMARQHGEEYYKEKADILLNGASENPKEEIEKALVYLKVTI